ncbi:Rcbtb1, partial [Symbiodinium natans]
MAGWPAGSLLTFEVARPYRNARLVQSIPEQASRQVLVRMLMRACLFTRQTNTDLGSQPEIGPELQQLSQKSVTFFHRPRARIVGPSGFSDQILGQGGFCKMTGQSGGNAANNPENNFWLWGIWGKRVVKAPFLTQKVPGKIRDIIIGQNFIIALKEDGSLVSWGEDKVGCLGLGTEQVNVQDPRKINFPSDFKGKIVDIQYGKRHVLALTSLGKVYAWGLNEKGQLGLSDQQNRYEPVAVEELRPYTVTQILTVDSMSYALTSHGRVYAWGDNTDGCLALEHDKAVVDKPEPMMRMQGTEVQKLVVRDCGGSGGKGKTVIAFVELAEPLPPKDTIGGFEQPLGLGADAGPEKVVLSDVMERDIFEGVDLMRQVMDNTQDWWEHILKVRHGSPYNDNPLQTDDSADKKDQDGCTAMQLDTYVGLDQLEDASYELDKFIQSARAQLFEIRKKKGTKNVKFMLSLFMDDCKLRREKIRRTVAARQLIEHKRVHASSADEDPFSMGKDRATAYLKHEPENISQQLRKVRDLKSYDIFTRVLQDSIAEIFEAKLQVLGLQEELLKTRSGKPGDVSMPGLKIIMSRWADLKRFSIYNLYQECNLRGQGLAFNSDDEMFSFLVSSSDAKIDQIIQIDHDRLVSRDSYVPNLCYELLTENAELRKMCNAYQLKVLLQKVEAESQKGVPWRQIIRGSAKMSKFWIRFV